MDHSLFEVARWKVAITNLDFFLDLWCHLALKIKSNKILLFINSFPPLSHFLIKFRSYAKSYFLSAQLTGNFSPQGKNLNDSYQLNIFSYKVNYCGCSD